MHDVQASDSRTQCACTAAHLGQLDGLAAPGISIRPSEQESTHTAFVRPEPVQREAISCKQQSDVICCMA